MHKLDGLLCRKVASFPRITMTYSSKVVQTSNNKRLKQLLHDFLNNKRKQIM